jgi:hypothetical protein
MTAATARQIPIISAEEIFRERAEARAILWAAGEYDLHEAVDVLQADAERTGLVAEIGQDAVQTILATAFTAVRVEVDQVPALADDGADNDRGPRCGVDNRCRRIPDPAKRSGTVQSLAWQA